MREPKTFAWFMALDPLSLDYARAVNSFTDEREATNALIYSYIWRRACNPYDDHYQGLDQVLQDAVELTRNIELLECWDESGNNPVLMRLMWEGR